MQKMRKQMKTYNNGAGHPVVGQWAKPLNTEEQNYVSKWYKENGLRKPRATKACLKRLRKEFP